MESLVTVRKCGSYEPAGLGSVIEKVFNDLGGLGSFIKPGDRVLLKPNLLKSGVPDEAVVTHPAVVEAVASMVKDLSAKPFLGESPGLGSLKRVLSKSGYTPFMERLGVEAVPFSEKKTIEFSDNRTFRKIELAAEIFDFDAVISLAKLKTHEQMVLTLAVKNLFGTVVGMDKASWHLRAGRDHETFATVLVQIYEAVRPVVSLVDGILGMEGAGPSNGDPRLMGILAASTDAVALDAVLCRLVGLDISHLRTSVVGQELGIGVADLSRIRQAGDKLDGFPLKDFKRPRSMTVAWNLPPESRVRKFLENHAVVRPQINTASCEACGVCRDHCPAEAISEKKGAMVIDYQKCISCFCCQELCEHDAVCIVRPLLGRVISKIAP
jgi:uncharacterized protein (DUF362 family)/Pyruvate/2-oxoacid:ferredoxin oxidoreductase delta subunit